MRLRYNKNAKTIIENSKYFISIPNNKMTLFDLFKNSNNCCLEIGCGKGDFIIKNAINYPTYNFIAMEKNQTVLAKAINKANQHNINNLFFLNADATNVNEIFACNSFTKIFLNFSDPWPKKRHCKRRLTNPIFLLKYQAILTSAGIIEFKTDNKFLFEYTYNDVLKTGIDKYNIIYESTDLYSDLNNEFNINNIPTEYETKFHSQGHKIYKLVFDFKKYENKA